LLEQLEVWESQLKGRSRVIIKLQLK
jgi:hypothetical protein